MLDILLTGVGGQGTVLAAKILAQAAQAKGWHVRTAETIGMAQRGGNVVSHVRMGDKGEEVYAPLLSRKSADLIVAFEPAEAARVLPYLADDGMLVTARTSVQPVTASLSREPYDGEAVIGRLAEAFSAAPERLETVDDAALVRLVGSRKALNTILLSVAVHRSRLPLGPDDLKRAIEVCVKPRFVKMNQDAVDAVIETLRKSD
ncbi:pyruvate ferredoxin oxidoreductase [Berryella intestinalis]|uniref:Pyruvate ferredoxin oxidoreductase n=1 Tax=Berryella intestinalis TaxID=1531429 RepID=A0A0A8B1I4_9ACTN|nr:indolepyruvate oxidoreductase subunit beta [Berryella intestinalis]AJC11356.1 pyruvate ferredoxin oxidoreductase [Berryella intestinalis]